LRKIIILAALVCLSGCLASVRYTYEEIRNFPPQIQEHIKKGEVVPGMTFQQVRLAWGAPTVTRVVPSNDEREIIHWVYQQMPFGSKTILVFTDGKLTGIISSSPWRSDEKQGNP
jgi:hypothetical protein